MYLQRAAPLPLSENGQEEEESWDCWFVNGREPWEEGVSRFVYVPALHLPGQAAKGRGRLGWDWPRK